MLRPQWADFAVGTVSSGQGWSPDQLQSLGALQREVCRSLGLGSPGTGGKAKGQDGDGNRDKTRYQGFGRKGNSDPKWS